MITWFKSQEEAAKAPVKKAEGDNFLSLATHELRSPLSIIKWYTEMLLEGDAGPLTSDQTKYLKTIEVSNQRAIDLIRSLLNVSRLELGTFCIRPTEENLSLIIHQVIDENKRCINDKKLSIDTSGVQDHLLLLLDKQMMLVILRNILNNAIAFSKEEGVIMVATTSGFKGHSVLGQTLSEDSIVISIKDNGIGIPDEDKSSVYHRLWKGSNVKDADSTGSGLGLYIVKTILSSTGGDIWFTSQKDIGTTFHVSIPITGMKSKEGRTTLD